MSARSILLIVTLLAGSCAAGPRGAAVQPAPPGPVDLVRILFGDYSGLCPRDYEYCRGGRHSICCPFARGCCAAADGSPACCVEAPGPYPDEYVQRPGGPADDASGYGEDSDQPPPDASCPESELTCSQGGRRVCCSPRDGCCVDEHGPYCCRR